MYKAKSNLLGYKGGTGAYLSTTIAAMTLFGAPPEKYWPNTTAKPSTVAPNVNDFDTEPWALCYAFGQNNQSINYYRLDSLGITASNLLQQIETICRRICLPCLDLRYRALINYGKVGVFSISVFDESVSAGRAVVAVGYDVTKKIRSIPVFGTFGEIG